MWYGGSSKLDSAFSEYNYMHLIIIILNKRKFDLFYSIFYRQQLAVKKHPLLAKAIPAVYLKCQLLQALIALPLNQMR